MISTSTMLSSRFLPPSVSLRTHPVARDKAVSTCLLTAGTTIVSAQSFTSLLLPKEKGHRCDFCLSLPPQETGRLQRCSGCASYWYCDSKCQTLHWPTHKKYCKNINRFCASRQYEQLEGHEKLDALLLTHLLAECSARATEKPGEDDSALSIFMSLLPGPAEGKYTPPLCPLSTSHRPTQSAEELFSRCGNNNFSIHSHLTTIAHGIFPLASRLFNHSCVPNAIAKYKIVRSQQPLMEVVAIRDIAPGEEICIPYADPALVETRQKMFQFTYGFKCTCPSCVALQKVDFSSPAPDGEELTSLGKSFRQLVFPDPEADGINLPESPIDIDTVPREIQRLFREASLTSLCESFSALSHDEPFESALDVGVVILAFYVVIYPPNYPQIGMHLLEMAKTAWNAFIMLDYDDPSAKPVGSRLFAQTRAYLRLSSQVWAVIGSEGDEGGPLAEIQVLERLLSDQVPV